MRLLATREYGFSELLCKLSKNDDCHDDILAVIERLRDEALQSDDRFTAAYVRSRQERGFGPVRIKQELRARNISDELMILHLQEDDDKWNEQLRQVREKKYGKLVPISYPDKMKQSQFLQYRGFSSEQIRQIFRTD